MDRRALEAAWLTLTRKTLPEAAQQRNWPVHRDHCFQRILLDHATCGVWYDSIPGRPAYLHASEAVLERAISIGTAVLAGRADVGTLNRQSLDWRGKAGPRRS